MPFYFVIARSPDNGRDDVAIWEVGGGTSSPPHRLLRLPPAAEWSRNDMVEEIFIEVEKQYYVYIMTNHKNTVLYTGVTNDLHRRVYEHKNKLVEGFTKRYNLTRLVYYELCGDIEGAIIREKQIKAGSRQKKIELVKSMNKEWRDLQEEL